MDHAWRELARAVHPDRAHKLLPTVQAALEDNFRTATEARHRLNNTKAEQTATDHTPATQEPTTPDEAAPEGWRHPQSREDPNSSFWARAATLSFPPLASSFFASAAL